jgi:2-keto-4-pentenoate hydratase
MSSDPAANHVKEIAQRFVEARLAHKGLTEYPGPMPETLDTAYQIQNHAIGLWDDEVVAWKVGGVPGDLQEKYGAKRLAGPVFKSNVTYTENAGHTNMPIFVEGYAAIEAEFVLQLNDCNDLPKGDLSLEQVNDAVKRAFIGVEIASSPLTIINDIGPIGPISDFGNNHGLIIGPELIENTRGDLSRFEVKMIINDEHIGTTTCPPGLDGPLGAVKFLLEHLRKHDITIPEDTYVSTGAITGVHQAFVDATSSITFEGIGSMDLTLVPSK